jgi:single-stranded DNA-binding protein
VFVEGRFRTREYETRDGQKRVSLEITADNVVSLERRTADGDAGPGSFGAPAGGFGGGETVRPTRSQAPTPPSRDDDLDDLPF